MSPFDSIQDSGSSSSSQWYCDMSMSSEALNGSTASPTRDMDTVEESLFSHTLLDDEGSRYLYQVGQAVSLIQAYRISTQKLMVLLDEMKDLVDQTASGECTSVDSQSSQTRWKLLTQEYENTIAETSSKVSLRLDNDGHALGLYINSNDIIEVRTADLRFEVGQRNVITEAESLQEEVASQQAKVDHYQAYLTSRFSLLINEQASSSGVNYAQSLRDGVNIQNEGMGKQLVTQITNTTMQLGVSLRRAFKVPSAMRVQFHTSANFPPFLWMLS